MTGSRTRVWPFGWMPFLHCFAALLLLLSNELAASANNKFVLKDQDVVAFLGGTNMLHMQRAGYLEAMLTQHFAAAKPTFRDLSWEADTVFKQGTVAERWRSQAHFKDDTGLGDLPSQLGQIGTDQAGATHVFVQFGQLESLSGVEALDQFVAAYSKLIDEIRTTSRNIVMLSPTRFGRPANGDLPDLSQRNADLQRYVNAIENLATEKDVTFVDLFSTLKTEVTSEDGMHLRPTAHKRIASTICQQLGINVDQDSIDFDRLRLAVIEKHRLWYDYWRPANWKLLFGDDARRQFTRGKVPFREEWKQLLPMVADAEQRVWSLAAGKVAAVHDRPTPEILHGDPLANVDEELAAFVVPEGFRVNLFASEQEGLTSPLNIRWDPAGRMYVTVTTTYPHVFPGDLPNDKIIRLEDRDGDGKADKSIVFADGLNIPTGIEWGDGGVYVGQNTEILFLKDADNDGRADERRVLLGGFGNGDSHQTINSFRWSPDGQLYFGHGDGCESRVETPWGISSLFNAGFYRLRPRRLQLIPFLEAHMGPGNPWGVAFDAWGQIFGVDGAGGVSWLSPAQVSTTHRRRFPRIGQPGGYCGIALLDGRGIPQSMQGHFVIGDYKANQVKRFSLKDERAGFKLQWEEPILRSRHRNFRPVDVKVGPDGAIYVVDWYNAITCHQDDAYRDPTRDKAHGRIWRISRVDDQPRFTPSNLLEASTTNVLDSLKSPEYWTRYQAKRALTTRNPDEVAKTLDTWVRNLDPSTNSYEAHLFQALATFATIERVRPDLLRRLLEASDPRCRAFATRIVGRWHDRLDDPLALLDARIADEHPRVRMEAIVATSSIPLSRSMKVLASAVDQPVDSWIDYALKQAMHRLKDVWLPAFRRGEATFEDPKHLATVLNEIGGEGEIEHLQRLVENKQLDQKNLPAAISAILAVSDEDAFRRFGLNPEPYTQSDNYDSESHAAVLGELVKIVGSQERPRQLGKQQLAGIEKDLRVLIRKAQANVGTINDRLADQIHVSALELAGLWQLPGLRSEILDTANDQTTSVSVRSAALLALGHYRLPDDEETLTRFATQTRPAKLRVAAIDSLTKLDLEAAATSAAGYFSDVTTNNDTDVADDVAVLTAFLQKRDGATRLASAFQNLDSSTASRVLRSLFASGRSDAELVQALIKSIGATAQPPTYSKQLVNQLSAQAVSLGDDNRGYAVFRSLACHSCHQVAGSGGKIGPDLTTLGTTLSSERIVEEVLWPSRQIKEGYASVTVLTSDGRVHTGFERTSQREIDSGDVVIEDVTSNTRTTIKAKNIEEKKVGLSAMPEGLTSFLSDQQLADLIKYLSNLGKLK